MNEKYNEKGYASNLGKINSKIDKHKNSATKVKNSTDENIDQGAGAFACSRIPKTLSNYKLDSLNYKNLQITAQTPSLTIKDSVIYNLTHEIGMVKLYILENEPDILHYKISFISKDVNHVFVEELLNLVYLIINALILNDINVFNTLIIEIDNIDYAKYISKILPFKLQMDKFGKSFNFMQKDELLSELISECRKNFYSRKCGDFNVPDLFPDRKNIALQYHINVAELLSGYNNFKLRDDRQTVSMPVLQSKPINASL